MKKVFICLAIILVFLCTACKENSTDDTIEQKTSVSETETKIDFSSWLGSYSYEDASYFYYIRISDYDDGLLASIEVRNIEMDEGIFDVTAINCPPKNGQHAPFEGA